MAEAIILPLAKTILKNITCLTGDLAYTSIIDKMKAAKLVKKDLKIITMEMEAICAVLEDAEKRQYTNRAIKIWLRDLKSLVYEMDDILDEVAFNALHRRVNQGHLLKQVSYYLSLSNLIISYFDLSHKVKDLHEKLDNIVMRKNTFGLTECLVETSRDDTRDPLDECAYVYEPSIIGRDEAKQDIINLLLGHSTDQLSVLPIVGMGGIGKTALAKLVHRDINHFDIKLWACVSDKFDIRKIIEDIITDGINKIEPNLNLGTLLKKLDDLLNEKKYFLVLDDVWVDEFATWQELMNMLMPKGKRGSVILITTRNERVASIAHTIKPYNLDRVSDHISWLIFKKLAFKEGEEELYPNLSEIGLSIVKKCCGIPLVVKSLGSLLRTQRDQREWERISKMHTFVGLHTQYHKVMQLLKLSYDKLPSHLKPCFAYMSLYVKDYNYSTRYLSYFWSALGVLQLRDGNEEIERVGCINFMELVQRSILQEPSFQLEEVVCVGKLHDLLHDLAVNVLGEELAHVSWDNLTISEFARHIIWENTSPNSLSDKEFPKDLAKVRNARTFRFSHRTYHISQSFLEGIISNFSYLRVLDLECSWFEELPRSVGNLKHLRYIDLSKNPIIQSLPNALCKSLNLETLYLDYCKKLKELPNNISQLVSLKLVIVTTCQMSLIGTKFNKLSSLQSLSLVSCKRLVSLWESSNVGGLASIRTLRIHYCPKLTSLPSSMKFLVHLETLQIMVCEELDLDEGDALQGLRKLRVLDLMWIPKMRSLPQGIQSSATSLQSLFIHNCGNLVELPDWLLHFSSLHKFSIKQCPNVLALPEGFHNLKSLREFNAEDCPNLLERRVVPTREDTSSFAYSMRFF